MSRPGHQSNPVALIGRLSDAVDLLLPLLKAYCWVSRHLWEPEPALDLSVKIQTRGACQLGYLVILNPIDAIWAGGGARAAIVIVVHVALSEVQSRISIRSALRITTTGMFCIELEMH